MNIEKLTSQFQQDLGTAQSIAISHNNSSIEGLHVLSAMVSDVSSSVSNTLESIKTDTVGLKNHIDQQIQ